MYLITDQSAQKFHLILDSFLHFLFRLIIAKGLFVCRFKVDLLAYSRIVCFNLLIKILWEFFEIKLFVDKLTPHMSRFRDRIGSQAGQFKFQTNFSWIPTEPRTSQSSKNPQKSIPSFNIPANNPAGANNKFPMKYLNFDCYFN